MIKSIISLMFLVTLSSNSVLAHADGPGVTSAKIIELTAHRIDRLVTLGKIDNSFLKKLEKMEVTIVTNQAPIYYKVLVSQTQPGQGLPQQLEIFFNDDGKPLSFQLIAGGTSGPDMAWPDKDAVSLSENALHFVLENNKDPKVALFDKGVTTFVLTKGIYNGEVVARGQLVSSLTSEKLNIYIKLDGTYLTSELIP